MSTYMLPAEVAKVKEVTPATVRAWEKRGILPAIRTASGTRLFKKDDVERFTPPRRKNRAS